MLNIVSKVVCMQQLKRKRFPVMHEVHISVAEYNERKKKYFHATW